MLFVSYIRRLFIANRSTTILGHVTKSTDILLDSEFATSSLNSLIAYR